MNLHYYLICLLLVAGCDNDSPRDEYNNFASRTSDYRKPKCESTVTPADPDTDLVGTWLLRSRLGAGLALGLRIKIERPDASKPRAYQATVWLHDQPEDAEPLKIVDTEVDENGAFIMEAKPLNLGRDVVQSESAVFADVILNAGIIDENSWCGTVEGQVTSPLNLDLEGSTFYVQRMGPDVTYDMLPSSCPQTSCDDNIDSGITPDMAVADAEAIRPESPPIENIESERIDLTGDWLMNASLAGLPLSLWITIFDHDSEGSSTLDGTVRLTRDEIDAPPRLTFFTEIDETGRFEIWFPGLSLEIEPVLVEGNLLLSAVSLEDAWCGAGAGEISSPFAIDLEGSSLYAIRWVPGTPEPEDMPNACPTPEAMTTEP